VIESSDKIMRGKNCLLSRDVQKAQNVKFEKEKKKERKKYTKKEPTQKCRTGTPHFCVGICVYNEIASLCSFTHS
jgi:hypothetical protein